MTLSTMLSSLLFWGSFVTTKSVTAIDDLRPPNNVTITDHGNWKQFRVCYPPFNWTLPLGMNRAATALFWKQPENWRHFRDTNVSDHCGVVRVIQNGTVWQPFPVISNVTHFINDESPPRIITNNLPEDPFRLILTGHWGNYFQHFFDNIGPQMVLALDALGLDPSSVPVLVNVTTEFPVVPHLWDRLGFRRRLSFVRSRDFSARLLAIVESAPRVHPHFFERMREMMNLPKRKQTVIVWVSRKMTNSYFPNRFVLNEEEVVDALRKRYGRKKVVVYDHKQFSLRDTLELFSKAICIMGSHGGGMYNQFFAPKETVIVELMPIRKNGMYHGQTSFHDVPNFSHMAVWSNSQLIGQAFWRYYQVSDGSNFHVDVAKFMDFLLQIPELEDVEL